MSAPAVVAVTDPGQQYPPWCTVRGDHCQEREHLSDGFYQHQARICLFRGASIQVVYTQCFDPTHSEGEVVTKNVPASYEARGADAGRSTHVGGRVGRSYRAELRTGRGGRTKVRATLPGFAGLRTEVRRVGSRLWNPRGIARKHLTPKEVAEIFATDDHVVRKWIRTGQLKAVNIGLGRRPCYRISEDEIARFELANVSHARGR